jgi:hypothetical protein
VIDIPKYEKIMEIMNKAIFAERVSYAIKCL